MSGRIAAEPELLGDRDYTGFNKMVPNQQLCVQHILVNSFQQNSDILMSSVYQYKTNV